MPEYNDDTLMPFGKHAGKKMEDVPASYLMYLERELRRDDWRDLQRYIKENYEVIKKQAEEEARK